MDLTKAEEAKERLLQMRRQVMQDTRDSYAASRELGQDGVPDIGDMSANAYTRDILLNLNEAQRRKLRDIDAALERIEMGVYGECARCGEEIAPRRMEVRPFSRFCVECKSDIEKFGE
jgi:DnaK suppressor protein